jgi:hypothetical protein
MSCKKFYRGASTLSIAKETDCNISNVTGFGIYSNETVVVNPETDSTDVTPTSTFAGAKDTIIKTCFARANFEISKFIERYERPVDFLNSDLRALLEISFLEKTNLLDTELLENIPLESGEVEVVYLDNQETIDAFLLIVANDGKLVFNLNDNSCKVVNAGKLTELTTKIHSVAFTLASIYSKNLKAITYDSSTDIYTEDGSDYYSPIATDSIRIVYSDVQPTYNSEKRLLWVNTNTRESLVHIGSGFVESDFIVGTSFRPVTYKQNTATITAIDDDTKSTIYNACASLSISADLNEFLKFTFNVYGTYKEQEGDFKDDIMDIEPPKSYLGSCATGELNSYQIDNPHKAVSALDLDSFMFDNARDVVFMKTFDKRTGWHSLEADPTITLEGGVDDNYKAYLSVLAKNITTGIFIGARDSENALRFAFVSDRVKTKTQEKQNTDNIKKISKTLSCRPKIEDSDNRYFKILLF